MEDKLKYPIVVIGSGFGGSVAATHLAESGLPVVLLERGPWRDTIPTRSMGIKDRSQFPRGWSIFTHFLRTLNASWLPSGRLNVNLRGLFELFYFRGIEVVCSSSVGGGSHVYSGVHAFPPDNDYWEGISPSLSGHLMRQHYENFFDRMGSKEISTEQVAQNHVSKRFADSDFLEIVRARPGSKLGILIPEIRDNPHIIEDIFGIKRSEFDYDSGDHGFLGSPSGGKTTLDFAYLAHGIRAGLEVRELCEVISLRRMSNNAYSIQCIDHKERRRKELVANYVVLAAGALNTLRILLYSRDYTRGLQGMPNLGKRFSGNGDMRGFWDLNDFRYDLSIGLPSQGSVRLKADSYRRQALSSSGIPSLASYPLPYIIRRRLSRGAILAGMGKDNMDGVVSIRGARLGLEFNPDNSPVYAQIAEDFREISRVSGRRVYSFSRPATVHPLGGACVANDGSVGVVDAWGEVFGNPGLFIADSSALPSSLGGPPSATIAAWSGRVAESLARRIGSR